MCGIAGIIDRSRNEDLEAKLKKMTDAIAHRGPDGEGFWINGDRTVGLGHRRLSIIDLSNAGDQPMHYLDRYTIIFNGEIYNYIELKENLVKEKYIFTSQSDTEVLLAMYDRYKEHCLEHLDGMFSFVIYDKKENILFCARDRFGEKPFYYYYEEGKSFCFASEMKSLWTIGIPKDVNGSMLFNYLSYAHLQNPADAAETFYNGIRKIKAAHYIKINTAECRIIDDREYWKLESGVQRISIDEAKEQFQQLFFTSVKRRLRSDVPVGSSLSGGLDSSLVVKTIDELKKGTQQVQKTFSARFPGHIKDEGKFMQIVIDRCNVEPYFTFPDTNTIVREIDNIFYHQEEPFENASIFAQYCVMQLARENGVIVLLDGQGADEILAGYHKYFNSFFTELKQKDSGQYKHELNSYMNLYSGSAINPVAKKDLVYYAKTYAAGPFKVARNIRDQYRRIFSPEFNRDFYQANRSNKYPDTPVFSSLNESLLRSTTQVGLEQLLRYADRNSMAHSLEVRLPFLYHPLVEFIFSLPADYKIRDGWTKWLMRVTFQELLPNEIIWRKDKIGYEPPKENWIHSKMVTELIYEKRKKLVNAGVLNKKVLEGNTLSGGNGDNMDKTWVQWMAGNLY